MAAPNEIVEFGLLVVEDETCWGIQDIHLPPAFDALLLVSAREEVNEVHVPKAPQQTYIHMAWYIAF